MKIVLVEDDDVVRENYAELLADEGFEVKSFSNRKDAIDYFSLEIPDPAQIPACTTNALGVNQRYAMGY